MPGVVLAIAAILLFLKPLPILGVSLYNTVWIILFCYLARFLVLGLRPVVERLSPARSHARGSVADRRRAPRRGGLRTIIVPLVAPTAAAGALLIFLTAFNELTVSALLWSSGSETLGVVFFSFQQGGDSTYAAALGVLTVAVSVALMLSTLLLGRPPAAGRAAMARLTIERLGKSYGDVPRARRRVARRRRRRVRRRSSAPSGCGKTTLLRQIAGFDKPDAGRILIGDTVVSTPQRQVPPERRRIGIVFQSYALWPHMTRRARTSPTASTSPACKDPERARRVEAALALVELDGFARAPAGAAVGRPAPARGARALPRDRAVAGAARRAARQPRRASARVDGARVRALPRAHRHDDDLHHARPGGGDGAGRPHRRDGQGPDAAGRDAVAALSRAGRRRRSRASSAKA